MNSCFVDTVLFFYVKKMFLPLDGQKESRMSGYGFFLLKTC